MKTKHENGVTTVVDQQPVIIPDLSVKDLLSAIPSVQLVLPCFFHTPDPTRQSPLLQAFGSAVVALHVRIPPIVPKETSALTRRGQCNG